jgi:hypothetical protein
MKDLFTVVLSTLVITLVSPMSAEPWVVAVDANLMLTQNTYSDNWSGEETGAISWTSNANLLTEKQLHAKVHNKNGLKLSFGQTYSQDKDTKEWSDPVKSTDLIDLESVLRFTLGRVVDPFAAGRIETQFYDDSDPDYGRLLNPVHFTESFGIAKVIIKENKREWSVRFGAGLRQHLNRDVMDTLISIRETQITNDGGLILVTDFTTHLAQERITFTSKLSVFKALFYSESDPLVGLPNKNYWKYPDVNWENILTASITEFLMVNLYVQFLYDKEIDTGMRFKETLSLGLTFKLI